ncbi:hypothetical protein CATMIT_01569, partial [Catenibacterium mitsuokai DSM 15897]
RPASVAFPDRCLGGRFVETHSPASAFRARRLPCPAAKSSRSSRLACRHTRSPDARGRRPCRPSAAAVAGVNRVGAAGVGALDPLQLVQARQRRRQPLPQALHPAAAAARFQFADGRADARAGVALEARRAFERDRRGLVGIAGGLAAQIRGALVIGRVEAHRRRRPRDDFLGLFAPRQFVDDLLQALVGVLHQRFAEGALAGEAAEAAARERQRRRCALERIPDLVRVG